VTAVPDNSSAAGLACSGHPPKTRDGAGGGALPRDASAHSRADYFPALDGVRALAVIGVILNHVAPEILPGGFVGVDVFFVLSGFLITSLLLRDLGRGTWSLGEFYLRRIQRLLPNALAVILATLALWLWLMPPNAVTQPGAHGIWTLLSASNLYVWKYLGGYWGDGAEWAPFTHFWSLGVEEQFYLCFPVSLLLLHRHAGRRLPHWLAAVAACSFALCVYSSYHHRLSNFYLLPTRLWEFALGALLAVGLPWGRAQAAAAAWLRPAWRDLVGFAGLGLIVGSSIALDESVRFPGAAALAPTVGTLAVILAARAGADRTNRCLCLPVLTAVGQCSYSLYLWHWPLITFGKMQAGFWGFPLLWGAVAGGLAALPLAWLAYRHIELPLRHGGKVSPPRLALIAGGFAATLAACEVLARPAGEDRVAAVFDRPTFLGMAYNVASVEVQAAGKTRSMNPNQALAGRYSDVLFPRPEDASPSSWRTGGLIKSYGAARPEVVVLGSSHGLMYAPLIDGLCRELGLSVAFFVQDSTMALFDNVPGSQFASQAEADTYDRARLSWIREWRPARVILIDRWDTKYGPEAERLTTALKAFVEDVRPSVGQVLFMTQIPVTAQGEHVNLRTFTVWRMRPGEAGLPELWPDRNEGLRIAMRSQVEVLAASEPLLGVVPAHEPFYHPNGSVRYAEGRRFFYADDDHLTDVGAEQVRALLLPALRAAAGR
jgi:peptidoglycan/LPS O-acetylase OafA/YrhL